MATAAVELEERVQGTDKVQRYGWTVKDGAGEFRRLHKKQLIINDEYQRSASRSKILELARDWSWIACGAVSVAHRDGSYWVVDGQHRVLAARKRSDIDELPCIVFRVADVAEEARGFLNANANRKPVSAVAKHRAAVVAEEPTAVALQAVLDELAVAPVPTNDGNSNHITCIASATKKVAEDLGDFRVVFGVALALARAANEQLPAILLDGLWHIHRNVDGGLNNSRLLKRVEDVGAARLIEGAQRAAAFFTKGGAKVWATGMLETLNKGLQKRFSFKGEVA